MDSVLVVIAGQGPGAMPQAVLAALHELAGPQQPHWLAPGEAFEVEAFPRIPEFLVEARKYKVDCATVSIHNRRKRLLLADMDSTMIEQECIDELGVVAGVGERIKAITTRSMRGELNFDQALRERVALLKGLPESVIEGLLADRITLMPGGRTLVQTMKAHGAYAALVSGGFTRFTAPIAARIGFDENRANILEIKNGELTGSVIPPILGQAAKREALFQIAAAKGLTPADAICVGDGANDLAMLSEAGLGVALHAKPTVQDSALVRINHADLTALLYLQGYKKSQFAAA